MDIHPEELEELVEKCKDGNHNFVKIHECSARDSMEVINWCMVCGAVTADLKAGNQSTPGFFLKLTQPLISQ